jgi:hypothetical protein
MASPETFVACPSCGCHAKSDEIDCPHCGARIRRKDGSVGRTAVAMLLGLTAVGFPLATMPACGSNVDSGSAASGSSGEGGNGGGGGMGGGMMMSSSFAAAYGVGGTLDVSTSNSGAAAYGVPLTDADGDGYYDAQFGGDDCDDNNPNVYPGAPNEVAGDGIDTNCNGNDDD